MVHGRANEALSTRTRRNGYPFARRLVKTTDRIFELTTHDSAIANGVRLDLLPHVLSTLFHSAFVRRFMFKTISQIKIQYRRSRLSEGAPVTSTEEIDFRGYRTGRTTTSSR